MATIRVRYSDDTNENIEVPDGDDVGAVLTELADIDWVNRDGKLVRILELKVLDDVAHQQAVERLNDSRPVFGRGLGHPKN